MIKALAGFVGHFAEPPVGFIVLAPIDIAPIAVRRAVDPCSLFWRCLCEGGIPLIGHAGESLSEELIIDSVCHITYALPAPLVLFVEEIVSALAAGRLDGLEQIADGLDGGTDFFYWNWTRSASWWWEQPTQLPVVRTRLTFDPHMELWLILAGPAAQRESCLVRERKRANFDLVTCPSIATGNGDRINDAVWWPRPEDYERVEVLRTVIANSVDDPIDWCGCWVVEEDGE
jgi:hypothetical protein